MLLHDARREARFDGQDLVLLPDQDRSRWDWRQIAEARDLLDRALLDPALQVQPTARGPYALQAAIASLQAEDPLDWPQIVALYGELADRTGSAVVRLNRAVAIAEADGPAAALAIVDGLDLRGYQYWHSTWPSRPACTPVPGCSPGPGWPSQASASGSRSARCSPSP